MKSKCIFLYTATLLASSLPVSHSAPPAWWSQGNPPAIVVGAQEENNGVANLGQGKWMAIQAFEALKLKLGASHPTVVAIEDELFLNPGDPGDVGVFDPTPPNPTDQAWYNQQKAPLLIGHLKAMAKPFYDHLNVFNLNWVSSQMMENGLIIENTHYWQVSGNNDYTENGYYPWNPLTPAEQNKAVATIGQLKVLFALRFEVLLSAADDSDGDGLSNSDELANGFDPNNPDQNNNGRLDSLDDFDADGVSNLAEITNLTDPNDPTDGGATLVNDPSGTYTSLRIYTPLN